MSIQTCDMIGLKMLMQTYLLNVSIIWKQCGSIRTTLKVWWKILSKILGLELISMWTISNHMKARKQKLKSCSLKQENQRHTMALIEFN
jgi:hypothetical protein